MDRHELFEALKNHAEQISKYTLKFCEGEKFTNQYKEIELHLYQPSVVYHDGWLGLDDDLTIEFCMSEKYAELAKEKIYLIQKHIDKILFNEKLQKDLSSKETFTKRGKI